jgi:hypothetical protein
MLTRRLTSTLALATALCGPAVATSCARHGGDSSTSSNAPSGLVLRGDVSDSLGTPLSDVLVYAEGSDDALASTEADGTYELALGADELARLSAALTPGQTAFHLFFESAAEATAGELLGLGEPVAAAERGERQLATVMLRKAAKLTGKVVSSPHGGRATPYAGATVRFGRSQSTSADDGTFTLDHLPSSALMSLRATAPQLAAADRDVSLDAGETTALDEPLVLFAETGVTGFAEIDGAMTAEATVAAGHPLQRSFRIQGSTDAHYFRYSHDPAALPALPWHPITSAASFTYEFPKSGGNLLYYEFSNDDQSALSEIYQILVEIDVFPDTNGIVVEDGSGVVTRRNVLVHVDVPAAARHMRFGETQEELLTRLWLPVAPLHEFTFSTPGVDGYGRKTLYCQFQDPLGGLSELYWANVVVQLWPHADGPVYKIEGGRPTTPEHLVRLDIIVPPNAYQMRLFEAGNSGSSTGGGGGSSISALLGGGSAPEVWLKADPVQFYTFTSAGPKTLLLQFRSYDASVSPVYQQNIRVLPFVGELNVGFQINGGAPVTASRLVDLAMSPPLTATQFRIYDNQIFSAWMALAPHVPYMFTLSGERTLGVQFRNHDLEESMVFEQTITVQQFTPQVGDVVIDGGALVTNDPTLHLSITPPPNATQMMVFEGVSPPSFSSSNWLSVAPEYVQNVFGSGLKTVFVKFRDINNDESGYIESSIYYDPFPVGAAGIVLDGGATTTTGTTVTATFFGGPQLHQLRVGLNPDTLQGDPWLARPASLSVTLPAAAGTYNVYVQFQSLTGEQSPLYFATITKS